MKLGGKLTFQYQVRIKVFLGVNKTLKQRPLGWKVKVGWIKIYSERSSGSVGGIYVHTYSSSFIQIQYYT